MKRESPSPCPNIFVSMVLLFNDYAMFRRYERLDLGLPLAFLVIYMGFETLVADLIFVVAKLENMVHK